MNDVGSIFRKRTLILACSVLVFSLMVVGVSYSSFSNIGDHTYNYVVEYYPLTITFKESDVIEKSLTKLSDEEGMNLIGNSFSVLNDESKDISYNIILSNNGDATNLDPKDIKISFDNNEPKSLDQFEMRNNSFILTTGILKKKNDVGDVTTHNLKIWASDQSSSNTNVNLKISVSSKIANNVLTDRILNIASSDLIVDSFGNTRYYGENPNNYIMFNNELWRIVGVFKILKSEGRSEIRTKIVKDSPIAYLPYSLSDNYGFSSNIGSVLFDYCSGIENGHINTYLSNTSYRLIDNAIYNMGNIEDDRNYHASDYYDNEISMKDESGRDSSMSLIGGLLSISDYYFASSDGMTNNYLNNGNDYWVMNYNKDINKAYYIDENGNLNLEDIKSTHNVKPTVFLKSTVAVKEGDGSLENPFVIE